MNGDIISKKTRYEFREYLTTWYLRQIELEFDAADIACKRDYAPATSGQRRSLVEQYYASLDFTKWEDVRKLLKVYENILNYIVDNSGNGTSAEAARLAKWLEKDGFAYRDRTIVSLPGTPLLPHIKSISAEFNSDHMARQIKRMEESVDTDPGLAIGSAKELVETCCKTILTERGHAISKGTDIPTLVKTTLKELRLVPEDVPDASKGAETIKRLLSNLGTVTQGLAELRGLYGSGHGKDARVKGLGPRHARLAIGAAATLAVFLFETHRESRRP
jgi:hypothetical protein